MWPVRTAPFGTTIVRLDLMLFWSVARMESPTAAESESIGVSRLRSAVKTSRQGKLAMAGGRGEAARLRLGVLHISVVSPRDLLTVPKSLPSHVRFSSP